MKRLQTFKFQGWTLAAVAFCTVFLSATPSAAVQPTPASLDAFNAYIGVLEARLDLEHQSANAFLARSAYDSQTDARLRRGEYVIDSLTPAGGQQLSGALLHDWRGVAFVPGAKVEDFEHLMKDFNAYPQHFSPQVLQGKVIAHQGDHIEASMRVRQQHILTVVMDTSYDVKFARLDLQHGYSISRSTHIAEIDSPGTSHEHELESEREHGFLWRLNTYWTYEERDGGLYIQIESVSLTRAVPTGLGWIVGPFIQSIPRESLEFTLRSTADALRR